MDCPEWHLEMLRYILHRQVLPSIQLWVGHPLEWYTHNQTYNHSNPSWLRMTCPTCPAPLKQVGNNTTHVNAGITSNFQKKHIKLTCAHSRQLNNGTMIVHPRKLRRHFPAGRCWASGHPLMHEDGIISAESMNSDTINIVPTRKYWIIPCGIVT